MIGNDNGTVCIPTGGKHEPLSHINYCWIAKILELLSDGEEVNATSDELLYLAKWLRNEIEKEKSETSKTEYVFYGLDGRNPQEEPTFDDFIQEGDEVVVNEDGSRFNRSHLERVIARQEEPVSDELKKEIWLYQIHNPIVNHTENSLKEYVANVARHFAEWGKNHIVDNNEMVSEESEKAADEWDGSLYRSDAFIAGANWQKQQMMKGAIEREVKVDAGGYPFIEATELYDYDNDKPLAKAGDKIKVLIVKDK